MSLTGALSSAISALSAQSTAISMISDNIANSSTVGYKTTSASFESLVTSSSSASSYASGGVATLSSANIGTQGLLTTTTSGTDMGIQGNGFFPVTNALTGGSTMYTRNGAFSVNASGYLTDATGNYLLGWRTDATGAVIGNTSSDNLVPIDTSVAATSGSPTTETTVKANLPADAAVGATYNSSMSVYDSLGTANSIQITWTKTGENAWSGSFANPTSATDPTKTTGTTTGSINIAFNAVDHQRFRLDRWRHRQHHHHESRHRQRHRRTQPVCVRRNHACGQRDQHRIRRSRLRQVEQRFGRQQRHR
jgi:flagellar hook protein FlgE